MIFGQEGVTLSVVGLPIERTVGIPTNVNRAVKAGGEGLGEVLATRTQQLGPCYGAICDVFGQEGVAIAAVVGLPIECASGRPTNVD